MSITDRIERAEMYLEGLKEEIPKIEAELKQIKEERQQSSIDLTNRQAAALLGVSRRTVIRMKADGRLKSTNFLDVFEYKMKRRNN